MVHLEPSILIGEWWYILIWRKESCNVMNTAIIGDLHRTWNICILYPADIVVILLTAKKLTSDRVINQPVTYDHGVCFLILYTTPLKI